MSSIPFKILYLAFFHASERGRFHVNDEAPNGKIFLSEILPKKSFLLTHESTCPMLKGVLLLSYLHELFARGRIRVSSALLAVLYESA